MDSSWETESFVEDEVGKFEENKNISSRSVRKKLPKKPYLGGLPLFGMPATYGSGCMNVVYRSSPP